MFRIVMKLIVCWRLLLPLEKNLHALHPLLHLRECNSARCVPRNLSQVDHEPASSILRVGVNAKGVRTQNTGEQHDGIHVAI